AESAMRSATAEAPREGAGRVEHTGARPVATCTVGGRTRRVSAVCPHLWGVVRWNDAEQSWDCPLHGSRFDADGEVLEGPATRGLRPAP
ncbi:MAG: Rieske 2Fe-2S domain-containing protein, partial [Actinomycetota bacterium]|nr:Rieske 2Fe-2S domain-containing protein [Actinomycetota bacterium]